MLNQCIPPSGRVPRQPPDAIDMTTSRNSQTRPLSYISTNDPPQPSTNQNIPIPPWKEQLQRLQAKTKHLQDHLSTVPEQFQQGALKAFIIALILGSIYLIVLLYTSPTCVYYAKSDIQIRNYKQIRFQCYSVLVRKCCGYSSLGE